MNNGSNSNSTVELFGHTFSKIKRGLDEKELIPFIEEMIKNHDKQNEQQEHLSSLTRLYEKTVIEADDLARQIKQEAEEEAQAAARVILSEAEENAQRIVEEKKAEARAVAQSEVHAIKANLEKKVETLVRKRIAELQSQLRDIAQVLSGEMVREAESIRKRAVTFEEELQKKLLALEAATDQISLEEDDLDESTAIEAEEIIVSSEGTSEENTEWVELEILPPRDTDMIESINTHLGGVDGVATTALSHLVDKTVIKVSMSKPIDLVETLLTLPEVDEAQEFTEGNQRKINVVLPIKSELERNKEVLNRTANSIASHISSVSK
jgi:hypothetical protein